MARIYLELTGGRSIYVDSIFLYPYSKIEAAFRLRDAASLKIGPTSTGLSFYGSPGWVVGASIANKFFESIAKEKNNREGAVLLEKFESEWNDLKNLGRFVDILDIKSIERPEPGSWFARMEYSYYINFKNMSRDDIDLACVKHKIDKSKVFKYGVFSSLPILDGVDVREVDDFVYDGSEFILVRGGEGEKYVRWRDVSVYHIEQ